MNKGVLFSTIVKESQVITHYVLDSVKSVILFDKTVQLGYHLSKISVMQIKLFYEENNWYQLEEKEPWRNL